MEARPLAGAHAGRGKKFILSQMTTSNNAKETNMSRQRLGPSSPSGRSIHFGEGLAETGQARQRLGVSCDLLSTPPPASSSQSISSNWKVGCLPGLSTVPDCRAPSSASNSCSIRLTSSREGTSRCDSPSRTLSLSTSVLSSATFPFSFWTSACNSSITFGHSGSHSSAHSGHAQFRIWLPM